MVATEVVAWVHLNENSALFNLAHSKHDTDNEHARALHIDKFATSSNAAHTPLGRQLPTVWAPQISNASWILEQNAKIVGSTVILRQTVGATERCRAWLLPGPPHALDGRQWRHDGRPFLPPEIFVSPAFALNLRAPPAGQPARRSFILAAGGFPRPRL